MGFKHPNAAQRFATTGWQALAGWRELLCKRWLLAFAVVGVLAACGGGIETVEWHEKVKFSDGEVVTVWRKERGKRSVFPEPGVAPNYYELRYDPQHIHWTGVPGAYDSLMSFDRVDGKYFLVRNRGTGKGCIGKKPGDYAIQVLRWDNGQWVEIPQAQAPLERIQFNLSSDPWGHSAKDNTQGLLTLDGQDGRPLSSPNRSGRDSRDRSPSIQAHFERLANLPRTKPQTREELYESSSDFCGYWHKKDREWECTSKNGTHSCVRRQPSQK